MSSVSARQLTVVIVHWNQPEVCLQTVERFRSDPVVVRVIVVDNGSDPTGLGVLRNGLPAEVQLVEVGENIGFGPGANRAWNQWLDDPTGTEWVALAPHDAQPAVGTLAALIDVAVRGPTPDGERYGLLSADVGDEESPFVDHVFGPITRPAVNTEGVELVDYPHGTLMLASRTCLGQIGLFDERFFAYCEEADLGLRAQAAGFAVGLVRGARVINPHVNTPSPVVDYLQERNTILLIAKHFGRRKAALRFALTVLQLLVGVVRPASRGPYWNARARARAIIDVLRGSWGQPPRELAR